MSNRMYRVPIHHDDSRFRDQTERMFRDMQLRMNHDIGSGGIQHWPELQTTWQANPVSEDAFFHLNPRAIPIQQVDASEHRGSREVLDDLTVDNLFIEDPQTKSRKFRMSFDVKKYDPKEIQTRVEDRCLLVEAKQVGPKGTSEFSRRIQLPDGVEADKLTSTLSSDGVLTLEAPCPPKYHSLTSGSGGTSVVAGDNILLGTGTYSPLRSSPITVQMPLSSTQHTTTSQMQMGQPKNSPISIQHTSVMTSPPPQPARSSPVVISVMPCTPASIPSDTPVFTTIDGGRRRLDLVLDLGRQYAAQDVVVKVDGRKMYIEATREEKEHGRVCKSSVTREFDLSEDIDPGTVQAMMRPDGQLAVVATTGYKR